MTKNHHSTKENEATHSEADTQLPAFHNSSTKECVSEAFDDRHHGIQHQNPPPFFLNAGEGIEDATGIHPELDAESDEQEKSLYLVVKDEIKQQNLTPKRAIC